MTTKTEDFGAVRPDNRPKVRPVSRRPDPDAAPTPAPAAAVPVADPAPAPAPVPPPVVAPPAAAPAPVGNRPTEPGPADPLPQPPGPPQPINPPRGAVAHHNGGGGTLSSVLTAPNHHNGHQVPDGVSVLAGLAGLAARPKDPMTDWTGDGTRLPAFIGAAARMYAQLTGRKTQQVYRDAMLGVDPIPADVLDAQWLTMYGYPREQYDPEMYR